MTRNRALFAALLLRRAPSPSSAFLVPAVGRLRPSPSYFTTRPPPSARNHRSIGMTAAATSSAAPVAAGPPAFFPTRDEAHAAAAEMALEASSSQKTLARCGDLACQHDSFLRSLEGSSVLGWALYEDKPSGGKGKKKKKGGGKQKKDQAHKAGGGDAASPLRCALVLSDSVFFPEGGGQPADRGRIVLHLEGDGEKSDGIVELDVLDGINLDGTCILTCRPEGSVKDAARDDLANQLGRSVVSVKQEIDWSLRFDHMTQHSAQHLLSAIAASDEFGNLYTSSFSLGRGEAVTSYIDFVVGDELYAKDIEESRSLLRRVEERANECIRRNLPMTPRYIDPESEEFAEKVRSRVLPEGLTGPLRLVEIGDGIDLNTCCGTHVPSLAHLQSIQLFRMEKVKGGVVRAHFAAAERLRRISAAMYDRQAKFTAMLCSVEEDHVERVAKMLDDKIQKEKEMKGVVEKLCALQAGDVARECRESGGVAAVDLGVGVDMGYMMQLSSAVKEIIESEQEGDSDAPLLLFMSSTDGGDSKGEEGAFLLTGDAGVVDRLGKNVAEALGGRGGGKNGRFQGKGTQIKSGLKESRRLLRD